MPTDAALALVRSLIPDGGRVLDAGCGDGALTVALAEAGYTAIGLDKDLEAIRPVADAHPKIPFFLDDLTDLELPMAIVGRGFDVVVLQDVVGTMGLADLDRSLAACASLAADGGRLVVTVPQGSVGTVARTAEKAGWVETDRAPWGDDLVLVCERAHAGAKKGRLGSLLRR